MRKGKHCKKPVGLRKRTVVMLASCLAVAALAVGGTVAWLTDNDSVRNIFSVGEVTTTVAEEFDGNVKKDVVIKNTGTVAAWIRATVVVTWQDENGNVYGQVPVAKTSDAIEGSYDYEISYDLSNGWIKGDDSFYYWTSPVEPKDQTGVLIKECMSVEGKAPDGYSLTVEVIGSGIQSTPADAFDDWTDSKSGLVVADDGKSLVEAACAGGSEN